MRYRIMPDQAVFFITWTVVDWLPVFVNIDACQLVVDSLNFGHAEKRLRINAFVIMPTHLHAIVFDGAFDTERLNRTLIDVRKYTGHTLMNYCADHMPTCYSETFAASAGQDRTGRFWKGGMQPEAIYTEAFWRQKVDYLHENPCRKGFVRLPEAWRFSSAAHWLEGGESDVILTDL